jgi:energy-coupling factor transporter transmembrane protein EcfT
MRAGSAKRPPPVSRGEGWHPGIKVATVLFLALGLVAGGTGGLLATAGLVAVLLARHPEAASRWFALLRRLRWVFVFILLLHGWLTPGPGLIPSWGAFAPSGAGLLQGGHLAGVVAVMAGLVAVLVRTTSSGELAGGLAWCLQPLGMLGLDSERFGRLLAWTVDRVEPVRLEAGAVRDALRLRQPGSGGASGRLAFEVAAARTVLRRAREAADRNAEALYLRGGGISHPMVGPSPVEWSGLGAAAFWAAAWGWLG